MPSGQYPAVVAGQVLTASLLESFAPPAAWKNGDTSRASTATLAVDPDLAVPVAANAFYSITGHLIYSGGTLASSDLQVQLTAPSGAGLFYWEIIGKDNATLAPVLGSTSTSGNVALGTNGSSSLRAADISGTVITGSSAGNVSLLWAQATSNSTATILRAGSWIECRRRQ